MGGAAVRAALSAAAAAVVLAAWGSAAGQASRAPLPTVGCSDSIYRVRSGRSRGYRVVLGVVSVPVSLPQVVRDPRGSEEWPWWEKAGLLVRTGSPDAIVAVAPEWRKRAAIEWGGSDAVSALRVRGCPPPSGGWSVYAGGFHLRERSACVPLVVRVGGRRATVRVDLHHGCRRRS